MAFDFQNFGTKEQEEQIKAKQVGNDFNFGNFGAQEQPIEQIPEQKYNWMEPDTTPTNEEAGFGTKYFQNLWRNYYSAGKGIQESFLRGIEPPDTSGNLGEDFKEIGKHALKPVEAAIQILGKGIGAVFAPFSALGETAVPASEDDGVITNLKRGAIAGAPLGPLGAAGGAGIAGITMIKDFIFEQPKIKEFLDANPNIREDIDGALNIGLAMVGGKTKPGAKAKGILEMPVEQLPQAVGQVAKSYAVPALKVAQGTAKVANTLAKFGTSQATGFSPETVSTIVGEMSQISKETLKSYTRENIANEAIKAISARTKEVAETGKAYEPIRAEAGIVKLKPTDLQQMIAENTGLKISQNGKLLSEASSSIRQPADVAKLQQFYNRYQTKFEKGQMSRTEFLNMREDLATLAHFEGGIGSSAPLQNLSGIMRGKLNTAYRQQIPGLEKLDIKFGKETSELKALRKNYFEKDGRLKDNAISTISNLTGKGKEKLAERMEKVSPGIIQKIRILKALEDIQANRGQKVGTYIKGATGGYLLSGGNPIAALMTVILSSPDMAVPILRGWGKILGLKEAVIDRVIKEFESYKQNPKAGMMIEDINKLSTQEIKQRIVDAKKYLTKMGDADVRYTFKQNLYDKISEYESILKERNKQQGGLNFKQGEIPEQLIPSFQGFKDITTNTLEKLKGKTEVSRQFISDLTNRPELKQVERDLIRQTLDTFKGDKIPVQKFADKVKSELLPLKVKTTKNEISTPNDRARYENISLPNEIRGNVANYEEHIYESPIKTSAGNVHFDGQSKNYFGHTRVEDLAGKSYTANEFTRMPVKDRTGIEDFVTNGRGTMGTTRRVIEVQSDLYQKGNLENESRKFALDADYLPDKERVEYGQLKRRRAALEGAENRNAYIDEIKENDARIAELDKKAKKLSDSYAKTRQQEVGKLQQYNDPTAHFRMVREEVKQAALDGKTKLQFPTGETAMKIEGLGEREANRWVVPGTDARLQGVILSERMLKIGREIEQLGQQGDKWIITDVLGDGKFKAVPKEAYNEMKTLGKMDNKTWKERWEEQFDISGKVDTNNPIYKFYEKDLGRYLRNKYEAKTIVDDKGVQWNEIEIKPEMKNDPVDVFSMSLRMNNFA